MFRSYSVRVPHRKTRHAQTDRHIEKFDGLRDDSNHQAATLLAAIDAQTQTLTKGSAANRRETRDISRDVNAGITALEQSLNARLDNLASQDDIHRLTQHLRWLEEMLQVHISSQSRYPDSEDGSLLSERSLASECAAQMHGDGNELAIPTLEGFEEFEDDSNISEYNRHHGQNDLPVPAPCTQTMQELDLSLDDESCDGSFVGLNICVAAEAPMADAVPSAPEEIPAISAQIVHAKVAPTQATPTIVQRGAQYHIRIPPLIVQCFCLYGLYTCCWWLFGGDSSRSRDNGQLSVTNSEGFVNTKFVDMRLE